VLFDALQIIFVKAGFTSRLMNLQLHDIRGRLRLKAGAQKSFGSQIKPE
jgi:hypothetical protein